MADFYFISLGLTCRPFCAFDALLRLGDHHFDDNSSPSRFFCHLCSIVAEADLSLLFLLVWLLIFMHFMLVADPV